MTACNIPAADLLPHTEPMVLLDTVMGASETEISACVHLRRDHPFADSFGIPSHVGLELMAQACGTWAGLQARKLGQKSQKGLLLGTRNFHAETDIFAFGDELIVEVSLTFRDGEMAVFDCKISRQDETVATASLTLYQPADDSTIFQA